VSRRTAWRSVHPDLRSSHGYRWPWPGNEAVAPLPDGQDFTRNGDPCPSFPGDGLCLAKTWKGAASGGIPAITCLLVTFDDGDVLAEDNDKLRVSRCVVEDVFDAPALLRAGFGGGANLRDAYLRGANLRGVNLRDAYLRGANLRGANLEGANLEGVNLRDADLRGANLEGANLRGADLRGANLEGAYLWGAYLRDADLRGANLRGAYLGGAYLGGAYLGGAYGRNDWDDLIKRGATR
jgi:hypothetical protein